jgi:multidrug efflux pump subunit AcrA (membrane-fusion protein)
MSEQEPIAVRLGAVRLAGDRLLESHTTVDAFFRELLESAVDGTNVLGGIVWMLSQQGRMTPFKEAGLRNVTNDGTIDVGPVEQQQLQSVMAQKQITILNGQGGTGRANLPPRAVGPIQLADRPVGVLELFINPQQAHEQQRNILTLVEEWCGYGSRFLEQQKVSSQPPKDPTGFWERFEEFTLQLQRTLDPREVCAIAVNDGRLLIGCDRLSIVLKEGRRVRVRGISGQDDVEHRANLTQAMKSVAQQVLKVGEPVVYRGTIEGLPPQLEKPLADFLQESRSRMALFLPLLSTVPLPRKEDKTPNDPRTKEPPRRTIGVLVVEQFSESRPLPVLRQQAELVSEHVAAALHNAETYRSIFLLWLWRALGRMFGWFRGRNLWIALAVLLGLSAIGATLAYVPWAYRVEGMGKLMPVDQREIFAPWDGDVVEVLVTSNQPVEAGQPLVQLKSDDLQTQLTETLQERDVYLQQAESYRIQERQAADDRRPDDATRLGGEYLAARVKAEGADRKVEILRQRMENLTVRSPIDGVVATFQIEKNLLNRPVRRGELLLQVMNVESDHWQLELQVPEYRMGHLLSALAEAEDHTLPVEYFLRTNVETTYEANVTRVATRTSESAEEGTVVEVFADIPPQALPSRRIGAEVQAKIDCGQRSLFYVLFGDVVEFFQRHLWL